MRKSWIAWIASHALCGAVAAADLTERAVVEAALSREAFRAAGEARTAEAEGEVLAAATRPNPEIALEHERMPGPGGRSAETKLALSQRFDVSGRRALSRQAAEERLNAVRHDRVDARRALIAEVRQAFAQALHEEAAAQAREAWVKRLRAAAETTRTLSRAGEVSGYARRRIEQELRGATARAMAGDAERVRARETLAALAGSGARSDRLVADAVEAPPPLELMMKKLEARPDLAALRSRARAHDRERTAAERLRLPDLTIGVGGKRVDEPGREDTGVLVQLAIPLPLFERGEAGARIASARAQGLRAEHTLALAQGEAAVRGAWHRAAQLREAAESLRRAAPVNLAGIAETAYRGGEGGILELLDAYRAELEAETTALELELRSRLARIELDALSGASIHE